MEKLITHAVEANREGIKGTAQALHKRRLVAQEIHDREVLKKLFDEIAPKYLTRPGGYTQVLKIGAGGRAKREKAFMRPGRRGDQAQMALISLVE